MYELKFNAELCASCPTSDCLTRCQYMDMDRKTAREEMMKIIRGEDSFVLRDCATCYSCEEYCQRENHPFYLITERREEKGMLTAPRPITTQWVNMCEPQGKYRVGKIGEEALSCCFIGELRQLARGGLFEDIRSSYVLGAEFFCQVVYLHFAKPSVIKERLPKVIENISQLGIKKLVCMHDECYGSFTSLATAYGMEVPFQPVHYFEHVYNQLKASKDKIKPLNIKAAYQRPCSSRLSPDTHHFVKDILDLIGVTLMEREYQDENALCCGEVLRMVKGHQMADDIQARNISDMVGSKAEYCVFNCPYCQMALSEKVASSGLKPVHIIQLCEESLAGK